jgi:hypothetical protein
MTKIMILPLTGGGGLPYAVVDERREEARDNGKMEKLAERFLEAAMEGKVKPWKPWPRAVLLLGEGDHLPRP